ncbi:FAD-dependent oxidoreductase [Clostridiales bacterium PH28_bin88]|nr:FAD-dependent oxidoreductase [Clostridiales bacterium PH28_bin88]
MRSTAQVVIIGGGVVGCAIAYNLAKKGYKDVVVLERAYLASGATGRCGAGVRQQWGTETNILLSRESVKKFEHLEEELGYASSIEFKQKGYILLAYTERQMQQFIRNVALQTSLGIPVRLVTPGEAKEIVPTLNIEGLLGAAYCPTDGHANPFHVTQAYAEAARRLGAEINTYTEVHGIKTHHDRVTAVITSKGDIQTSLVVNAAGAHAGVISKMAGLDLPLYAERHQALVTEPVEPIQNPMVISFHHHLYCQQTPHGSFIMGIGDPNEPKSFNIRSGWQFLEEVSRQVTQVLPVLKEVRVVRQWAGLYDMSPDANPILGECPPVKGLYVAAGFSGHGFMIAPMVGQVIAEMILGEPLSLPVQRLGLDRFRRGEYFMEPSVV